MLAKKCDRCGRLYTPYIHGDQTGTCNGVRLCRVDEHGTVLYERPHLDLCNECMNGLKLYLDYKKETAKNEN